MARFRLTLAFMAFAILYSAIAVPEDQDTPKGGTITGDIKDTTLRENYLSGVRVVFVNADSTEFETQTDKGGHFERAGLPAGQYVVNIYKPGYEEGRGIGMVKRKNVIRGRILEMDPSDALLSDVKVVIENANRIVFTDTTNADGEYECRGLSPGRYLISLHRDGYIERKGMPLIVPNNGNYALGVAEEGMFVSYAVVADRNLLNLTHGMRKK